jgi:hypothetical protein
MAGARAFHCFFSYSLFSVSKDIWMMLLYRSEDLLRILLVTPSSWNELFDKSHQYHWSVIAVLRNLLGGGGGGGCGGCSSSHEQKRMREQGGGGYLGCRRRK